LAALGAAAFAAEALVAVVLDAAAGLIGIGEMGEAINRTNPNQKPREWCIPQQDSHQTMRLTAEPRVQQLQGQFGQQRDGIAQPGALNGCHRSDDEPNDSKADRWSDSGLKQAGGAEPREISVRWAWKRADGSWNGRAKAQASLSGVVADRALRRKPGEPRIFPLDGTLPGSDYSPQDCSTIPS
jgi:hypothetical protein